MRRTASPRFAAKDTKYGNFLTATPSILVEQQDRADFNEIATKAHTNETKPAPKCTSCGCVSSMEWPAPPLLRFFPNLVDKLTDSGAYVAWKVSPLAPESRVLPIYLGPWALPPTLFGISRPQREAKTQDKFRRHQLSRNQRTARLKDLWAFRSAGTSKSHHSSCGCEAKRLRPTALAKAEPVAACGRP